MLHKGVNSHHKICHLTFKFSMVIKTNIEFKIETLNPIFKSENETFEGVQFVLKVPFLRHDQDYLNYGSTARLPIRLFRNAEPYRRSLY